MKATVAQLKKKIKALTANTGTDLNMSNPFWMNKRHIDYMRDAFRQLIVDGEDAPDRKFTPSPSQIKSITGWIDGLENKYLF